MLGAGDAETSPSPKWELDAERAASQPLVSVASASSFSRSDAAYAQRNTPVLASRWSWRLGGVSQADS